MDGTAPLKHLYSASGKRGYLQGLLAERGGFISPNKAFIFFRLKIVSPEIPPKVPPPKRCYREFGPMLASAQIPPEFSHGAPMGCQRINSLALVGSEPGSGDNLTCERGIRGLQFRQFRFHFSRKGQGIRHMIEKRNKEMRKRN
jgi:hypothetical protein